METKVLVFVVEDELLIQHLLVDVLEEAGYSVAAATDADNALKQLETQGDQFRALITDVNLGNSNITGWDIARRAREINPNVPVIYMTSVSKEEWSANGVPHSILVTKPFANAQIVTAVSQLLNAGAPPAV